MLLLALFACAAETPPTPTPEPGATPPVATIPGEVSTPVPTAPSAETLAAAVALHDEAAATDAAFAAELAGRDARKPTHSPCTAILDAARAAIWVTPSAPAEAPGVRAAAELLHAVNPTTYAGASPAGVAPANVTVGIADVDFARVHTELSSTRVFYWETAGTPPVLDETAKPAPGERVFTGGHSAGRAWVWDGTARRFACVADVTVENTAPIVTKAEEKVGWDIGLAVAEQAAKGAVAVE